ncbi:MAG: aldolase [Hydrogenophaga sp.]|nr:aldolase [Hydrogenophaga sp.]
MSTTTFTSLSALRDEVCRVGHSLFQRGYVHATAGNISVRVPEDLGGGFLITPTDACLGDLSADALAWVEADGQQICGDRASKTLHLHRRIYAAVPAAQCVIHTHSTNLVAWSLRPRVTGQEWIPPITPYFVMKVGRVPLIPYHRPGDPEVALAVVKQVAQAQAEGRDLHAVMLERLGPNVWGQSPAAAMAVLEELEETAKLCLMTQPLPAALTERQIGELRHHFSAPW